MGMGNDSIKVNDVLNKSFYFVKDQGYNPIMTVLVGSQNYGLAIDGSDYDTYTFVLPSIGDVAYLREPVSEMFVGEDGHINVKDIRLALNLLRRTSPNSVEWFSTPHMIVVPKFAEDIFGLPWQSMRCDTQHMMHAIGGRAHQLLNGNTSPGKRLSHLLRLSCMIDNYFDIQDDSYSNIKGRLLSMSSVRRDLAIKAKMRPYDSQWNDMIPQWEALIQKRIEKADVHFFDSYIASGFAAIDNLQLKLTEEIFKG